MLSAEETAFNLEGVPPAAVYAFKAVSQHPIHATGPRMTNTTLVTAYYKAVEKIMFTHAMVPILIWIFTPKACVLEITVSATIQRNAWWGSICSEYQIKQ
jgi:hypothetical protein